MDSWSGIYAVPSRLYCSGYPAVRTRFQYGSLRLRKCERGSDVWEFRYYETNPEGKRIRQGVILGELAVYRFQAELRPEQLKLTSKVVSKTVFTDQRMLQLNESLYQFCLLHSETINS